MTLPDQSDSPQPVCPTCNRVGAHDPHCPEGWCGKNESAATILSLAEVDVLTDALDEGQRDGAWDHWGDQARERLDAIWGRLRDEWNAAPREERAIVVAEHDALDEEKR